MQYKFRGKRVDNGEWVYGSLHHCHSDKQAHIMPDDCVGCNFCSEYGHSSWIAVHPDSVGMWTGLKDRNEYIYIYDDDFCLIRVDFSAVDADKSDYRELKVRIFYDDEMFAWCWHWKEIGGYGNSTCTFSEHEFDVLKVIGNTTDNPELLE